MISRKIAESMAALAGGMGEQPGAEESDKPKIKEQSFFKDDEIKKRAETLGSGVSFVKMERIANKQYEGYTAVYSFKDISKLHIEQSNPGMPKQMEQGSEAAPAGVQFQFTPGKTAQLVVKQLKKRCHHQRGCR